MQEINQEIYDKAIKLLSIRLHTTGELHRKLKQRGFKDPDILPVLRRLEELDFLNDERFAQIFVDNLKRFKDWGYYGIKAKLQQRQIPSDISAAALSDFFTALDEEAVAHRLVGKLKKRKQATYEKLARSMQSKGFRMEAIKKALTGLQ